MFAHFKNYAPQALRGKNYAAVFDMSGKLVKKANQDFGETKLAELASKPEEGGLAMGDDGNAYLLRRDEIVVVSPTGELIRRIRYVNPQKDQIAVRISVSAGLAAIFLNVTDTKQHISQELLLLDLRMGEPSDGIRRHLIRVFE